MRIKKIKEYNPKHWSTVKILDPDSGELTCRYSYKRKTAHRVVVDTPKSKTLCGYLLIEKDLRSTLVWLNEVHAKLDKYEKTIVRLGAHPSGDRAEFNIIKALFVSSLTFYGKCFAQCKGRGVKLDKKIVSDEYKEIHDEVIVLRNNFAAHSGEAKIEEVRVVIALDKNKKKGTLPHFARELNQPDSITLERVQLFIEASESLLAYVNDKIKVLTDKIYQEDILDKGLEYWYGKVT
jgi:hypothetical protein